MIGDRAFGEDPHTIANHAGVFAAGLRNAGGVPVFKHFPGHGRADGDSHTGIAITDDLGAMRAVSDRYGLADAVELALHSEGRQGDR